MENQSDNVSQIHDPVMLAECVDVLGVALSAPGSIYVDATCGLGGHTEAILRAFPEAYAIGIDRDADAIALATRRLEPFDGRFEIEQATYDRVGDIVADANVQASAILFDLGMSSLQIDDTSRGFAYATDAPLDMRMDRTGGITAADIVNEYSTQQLTHIFRDYGEEPFAARIAARIVEQRATAPIASTGELARIAMDVVPRSVQAKRGHPAKRIFQAIRIEVNQELAVLEAAIPAAIDALREDGRIVVMSYHSLEDRIVKRAFARAATDSSPAGLPVALPGHGPRIRLITKGAVQASPAEKERNPRSASVRFRAAEKHEGGLR